MKRRSIQTLLRGAAGSPIAFFRDYHPIVHTLILGTVLARAAGSMSLPFLAIYLAKYTSGGIFMNSIIVGVASLAGTLGGFFGGTLSDRIGRKAVMLAALFCWGFVFIGFSVARAPLIFILLNILNGLCRSFFEPVSQALMADLTPKEKRFRVFSLRYFAINVGAAVGPLAGAYFGLKDASLPFLITGMIYLGYAILLHFLLLYFGIRQIEGEKKSGITFRSAWNVIRQDVPFRYYLAGGIIGSIGYSQMTVTLSQYLEKSFPDGMTLFASLISLNAITVLLMQLPLTTWMEKRSALTVIMLGNLMFALGDVGFALSDGRIAFMVSMFVFTIGEILIFPSSNLLIDKLAPEGMRGTYFGAQTFTSLGHFFGPLIGGFLLAQFGGTEMFLTMAVLTISGTWFYRAGNAWVEARRRTQQGGASLDQPQAAVD